jgi:hypothetical protein
VDDGNLKMFRRDCQGGNVFQIGSLYSSLILILSSGIQSNEVEDEKLQKIYKEVGDSFILYYTILWFLILSGDLLFFALKSHPIFLLHDSHC